MDLVPSLAQRRSIIGGESAFWGKMLRLWMRGVGRGSIMWEEHLPGTLQTWFWSRLSLLLTAVWVPSLLSWNTVVQPLLFEGHRKSETCQCPNDFTESAEWCCGLWVQQQQSPVRSYSCLPGFKEFEMQRTCKCHPSHKCSLRKTTKEMHQRNNSTFFHFHHFGQQQKSFFLNGVAYLLHIWQVEIQQMCSDPSRS